MAATDAVLSKRPLPLDIGKGLGQWDYKEHPDLFIAQPGVYFSPTELREAADIVDLIKSRGVRRSIIGEAAPLFLETFDQFHHLMRDPEKRAILLKERKFHEVPVTVPVFYGHKLALARGKPILAGKWEDVTRLETSVGYDRSLIKGHRAAATKASKRLGNTSKYSDGFV